MNILAVGDVVGSVGIVELQKRLQKVKKEYNIDFCIVNGENAAERNGANRKKFQRYFKCRSRLCHNGKSYMGEKGNI